MSEFAKRACWLSGMLTGIVLALTGAVAAETDKERVEVTLLLVSDIYKMEGSGPRGGFARAAAVARAERADKKNILYIHAGDTISPSLMSSFDKGAHVIDLLMLEPPDIFVPGNHEFDFGDEIFRQRVLIGLKGVDVLGANIRDLKGRRVPGITDAKIYEFDGVRLGFLGITDEGTPVKSSPEGYVFGPPVEVARQTAKALREEGADIVIGVVHTPRGVDRALVADGALDVILSGDDHNLEVEFDANVLLVETREEAEYMVAVDLMFEISRKKGKRKVKWWPGLRIIDTVDYPLAADVSKKMDSYLAALDDELNETLGVTETELDSTRNAVRGGESAIGNLIADAMRESVGADVAIANGGGIRGNKTYPAGYELSRRDILTELPFGNTVLLLELSGEQILQALENGVSKVEDGAGRFPHVSGMSFKVDYSAPAGARVSEVRINDAPLNLQAQYKLATNNYMAGGGDGYSVFKGAPRILNVTDAQLLAGVVMDYIAANRAVAPRVEGRIESGS